MDQDASRPLEFALGQVVITRQALEVLSQRDIHVALVRHQRADWGLVDATDWSANDQAVQQGGRLLSVYQSQQSMRFWIITEADRSATTILLPDEY